MLEGERSGGVLGGEAEEGMELEEDGVAEPEGAASCRRREARQ
jgi:hypothetical protein